MLLCYIADTNTRPERDNRRKPKYSPLDRRYNTGQTMTTFSDMVFGLRPHNETI